MMQASPISELDCALKKRILKIAIVLLLTVVVVFLSLVAAVRYFFPAEVVREELESLLSSRVGGASLTEAAGLR